MYVKVLEGGIYVASFQFQLLLHYFSIGTSICKQSKKGLELMFQYIKIVQLIEQKCSYDLIVERLYLTLFITALLYRAFWSINK